MRAGGRARNTRIRCHANISDDDTPAAGRAAWSLPLVRVARHTRSVTTDQASDVRAAPFRCLLDTMILDKIVEDDRLLDQVQRLSVEKKLELVVTSVTERQVEPITDESKRARIASVPRTVIGTVGFILDYSQLDVDRLGPDEPIEAIRKGRRKETADALIAATAEWDGLLLVTEDVRLRRALERRGTRVCGWEQLRQDIERLADDRSG